MTKDFKLIAKHLKEQGLGIIILNIRKNDKGLEINYWLGSVGLGSGSWDSGIGVEDLGSAGLRSRIWDWGVGLEGFESRVGVGDLWSGELGSGKIILSPLSFFAMFKIMIVSFCRSLRCLVINLKSLVNYSLWC